MSGLQDTDGRQNITYLNVEGSMSRILSNYISRLSREDLSKNRRESSFLVWVQIEKECEGKSAIYAEAGGFIPQSW